MRAPHVIALAASVALGMASFVLSARAADPVFPGGSRIGLVPPDGMVPSRGITGFNDPKSGAAIDTAAIATHTRTLLMTRSSSAAPVAYMMDYDISYSIMTTQPAADVLREAKKGSAELVILALLEDTARHGYELAARIETESEGALSYNFASLYATLYKLEGRGWIHGRWVERPGQRRRRKISAVAGASRARLLHSGTAVSSKLSAPLSVATPPFGTPLKVVSCMS